MNLSVALRNALGWTGVAAFLILGWATIHDDFYLRILIIAGLYATVVVPLDLLIGYMGYIPFGQAAFFGLGAYIVGNLTVHQFELNFWVAFLLMVSIMAVIGYLVSIPMFRLTGAHFAVGTLALGQVALIIFNSWDWGTGGAFGIAGIQRPVIGSFAFDTNSRAFLLVVFFLFLVTLVSWSFTRGRMGRVLNAIRQDEVLARARGLEIRRVKRLVFAWAAVSAGIAGALFAPIQVAIAPAQFTVQISILFVILVVLGGSRSLIGPAIGAVGYVVLQQLVQTFAEWNQLVLGGLLVLSVLFFRRGIWGAVSGGVHWLWANARPRVARPSAPLEGTDGGTATVEEKSHVEGQPSRQAPTESHEAEVPPR